MPLEWTPLHTPTAVENNRSTASVHGNPSRVRLETVRQRLASPSSTLVTPDARDNGSKTNRDRLKDTTENTGDTWVAVSAGFLIGGFPL